MSLPLRIGTLRRGSAPTKVTTMLALAAVMAWGGANPGVAGPEGL